MGLPDYFPQSVGPDVSAPGPDPRGGRMFEQVRSAVAPLEAVVRDFEPGVVDGSGAVTLVELFTHVERLGAAGKGLAAKRVDETGAYRRCGERSAGHWLATQTGVTVGSAMRVLQTAQALDSLPATQAAVRAGKLSESQACAIAGAAAKNPDAETKLLRAAQSSSMKGLKDRCREVRAAAETDDAAWAQRLHESRHVHEWCDLDGAYRADVRLAPDAGAYFKAALTDETDRVFRQARREGREEPRDAYAADALMNLVLHGPRKPPSVTLMGETITPPEGAGERTESDDAGSDDAGSDDARSDRAEPAQRWSIPGIGPIATATAQQMMRGGTTVHTLPTDHEHLDDYSSEGRYVPTELRRWLAARYPVCGVTGCDADFRLEIDHVQALEDGGLTEIENLWCCCPRHHRLKHHAGWRITGTTHDWNLIPPDTEPEARPDDPDPP